MIPAPHPTYSPAQACEALSCKWRGYAITACKDEGCAYRWTREAAEDRARRTERDAARRVGSSPACFIEGTPRSRAHARD